MGAILAPQTKEPAPASASPTARDLRTLVREQRRDDVGGKSPLPMETEGQSRQRVGGGCSFWLLCVVVVLCVVVEAAELHTYEMSVEHMWVRNSICAYVPPYHHSIFLHTNSEKSSKCQLKPTQTATASKK